MPAYDILKKHFDILVKESFIDFHVVVCRLFKWTRKRIEYFNEILIAILLANNFHSEFPVEFQNFLYLEQKKRKPKSFISIAFKCVFPLKTVKPNPIKALETVKEKLLLWKLIIQVNFHMNTPLVCIELLIRNIKSSRTVLEWCRRSMKICFFLQIRNLYVCEPFKFPPFFASKKTQFLPDKRAFLELIYDLFMATNYVLN